MNTSNRKRILVALCEGDRLQLQLLRLKRQQETSPFSRILQQGTPWLATLSPLLLGWSQKRGFSAMFKRAFRLFSSLLRRKR